MPGRLIVGFTQAGAVREIVRRPDAPALLRAGALTPDQLAYAHGAPLWADVDDLGQRGTAGSLRRQLDRAMRMQVGPPRAVAARGLGLFVVEQSPRLLRMAQEMTLASLESLRVAADFGGPRGLSRNAASYIEGWPYEEFRRAVAARGRAEGLLRSAGR
jgi:rhamnose utilization protein RhaD (predicted bifunctional aldolase and dehydrogenase)